MHSAMTRASMQVLVTRLRRVLAGTPGGRLERLGEGYRLHVDGFVYLGGSDLNDKPNGSAWAMEAGVPTTKPSEHSSTEVRATVRPPRLRE